MRIIPPLDRALIEALDERVPERCPDPSWSDREIWIYTGKRELIRLLKTELEAQEDNILKD